MPRNPKNPKDYTAEPRQRADEKLNIVLDMLIQFHHSTRELLLQRLGLATHSHHTYFKTLEKKGFIRRVDVFSIKNRFVYMLTPLGKELAAEKTLTEAIHYQTDISKINHSSLRHDLAVQKFIVSQLSHYEKFTSERFLPDLGLSNKKKPDACLEKDNFKTMLEVELTAKSDQRIYRAFHSHAEALIAGTYQKVLYVFPSSTIKNYYLTRFKQPSWPCYLQNQRGAWLKHDDFYPEHHSCVQDGFEFISDESLIEDI